MSYLNKLVNNWPLAGSSLELLISAEKMHRQSRADEISWSRSWACVAALEFCALKHFQFDTTPEPLAELISESIRLGIEFYYGDWWHKNNVITLCEKRGWALDSNQTKSELRSVEPLSDPAKLEPWRDTLSSLMLLCTLSNRLDERTRICNWFGSDPRPEYTGLYWETEATTIALASYFRNRPMEGVDKMIAKIAKSKRVYALIRLKLIQACFEGDQAAFDQSLPEALDRFYKSFKDKEPGNMSGLIAVDESTVVQIALSKGLTLPKLTEKQQWALMTPASIGLESSQPT